MGAASVPLPHLAMGYRRFKGESRAGPLFLEVTMVAYGVGWMQRPLAGHNNLTLLYFISLACPLTADPQNNRGPTPNWKVDSTSPQRQ